MSQHDVLATPVEFKFVEGAADGDFEGYGSVFKKEDYNNDLVLPGAFAETLAGYKTSGTMPGMFVEHSAFKGGDPLPVGVWKAVSEDSHGLNVKGKISALDTDHGRRVLGLMRDKALRGLSIAFNVPSGGATFSKKADEPRRTIHRMDLHAIDIVRDPANVEATIREVKSLLVHGDAVTATTAIAAALALHRASLTGGNSPTAEQRLALLEHLQAAHKALTGDLMPMGMKAMPTTIREFESWLREEFGISNSEARALAENGFRTAPPRDEDGTTREAMEDIAKTLAGFSLNG